MVEPTEEQQNIYTYLLSLMDIVVDKLRDGKIHAYIFWFISVLKTCLFSAFSNYIRPLLYIPISAFHTSS